MAKALLGYVSSDPRKAATTPAERLTVERLTLENRKLHRRVADLEALVTRLSEENDALAADAAPVLVEPIEDMQPA